MTNLDNRLAPLRPGALAGEQGAGGLRGPTARKAAWLLGCLAAWLFGCLVVWLFGCLAAWLLGFSPVGGTSLPACVSRRT